MNAWMERQLQERFLLLPSQSCGSPPGRWGEHRWRRKASGQHLGTSTGARSVSGRFVPHPWHYLPTAFACRVQPPFPLEKATKHPLGWLKARILSLRWHGDTGSHSGKVHDHQWSRVQRHQLAAPLAQGNALLWLSSHHLWAELRTCSLASRSDPSPVPWVQHSSDPCQTSWYHCAVKAQWGTCLLALIPGVCSEMNLKPSQPCPPSQNLCC